MSIKHTALLSTALAALFVGGLAIKSANADHHMEKEQAKSTAVAPSPNGITIPEGYKDWRVIGTSHRTDHESLRVILGNDIAVDAARSGQTNPWPEGTILAKMVWFEDIDENWEAAIIPGEFVHAEFMIKDSEKYKDTFGWGYARWLGEEQTPYGEDADVVQECLACHTPVESRDYVFTTPAIMP